MSHEEIRLAMQPTDSCARHVSLARARGLHAWHSKEKQRQSHLDDFLVDYEACPCRQTASGLIRQDCKCPDDTEFHHTTAITRHAHGVRVVTVFLVTYALSQLTISARKAGAAANHPVASKKQPAVKYPHYSFRRPSTQRTLGTIRQWKLSRKLEGARPVSPRTPEGPSSPVAYLGGPCACPPFQPTIIFYDGIFGCFTNFFLLKHQNLGIQ